MTPRSRIPTARGGIRRPPFADDRATYVGLAVPFTFFVRVIQTRFLPFRFRDLRLYFLRETSSM